MLSEFEPHTHFLRRKISRPGNQYSGLLAKITEGEACHAVLLCEIS